MTYLDKGHYLALVLLMSNTDSAKLRTEPVGTPRKGHSDAARFMLTPCFLLLN